MQYQSFRIRNFKGIKDTTVSLQTIAGASVFAFVGLNESGKTTVLEAIHTFSPDTATSELLSGDEQGSIPFSERVPRHLLSEFTGDVSITASLSVTTKDRETLAARLKDDFDIILNASSVPDTIVMERIQRFAGGDFKNNFFSLRTPLSIKTGSQKKWRIPTGAEIIQVRDAVYALTPDIAYFPTFVFNFPEKIYLTKRGGKLDEFYRRVFQDILDADGRNQTIEKDIVRRIRGEDLQLPWVSPLARHANLEAAFRQSRFLGGRCEGRVHPKQTKGNGERSHDTSTVRTRSKLHAVHEPTVKPSHARAGRRIIGRKSDCFAMR